MNALGRHLLVELFDCNRNVLSDPDAVKGILVEAARRARATIVGVVFHKFNPFGVSGVIVIAESHLTIHTWPEYGYAAVDIFSCGETMSPETAVSYCAEELKAGRTTVAEVQRGILLAAASPAAPQSGKR